MEATKKCCENRHDDEICGCCAEKIEEHEDGDIRADIIKIAIAGVLFVIGIFLHGLPHHLLLLLAYLIVGAEVIINAAKELIKEHSIDEEFLMSIATIGAWAIGESAEAAAVMLFYAVGELLEDIACERSRKSITSLLSLRPDEIVVMKDGSPVTLPLGDAKAGDIAVFSAGDRISVDGIIVSGETLVDNSALTGESIPENKTAGDMVYGGGLNKTGRVEVRITKPYAESSSARILELVENAQEKKATSERFITRFAKKYTVAVVALALLTAFVCPIFTGYSETFRDWLYRGLTLLVVSCPCAFVISVPLSFFAGIGCASRNGILVKGAASLETMSKMKAAALDKTGTLTKGELTVISVEGDGDTLRLAAYAEASSSHPIAKAIVKTYGKDIDYSKIESVSETAGKGVAAVIEGGEVTVGKGESSSSGLEAIVRKNGSQIGKILLADELKPDSAEAISKLKETGVGRIVMLSGDRKGPASEVAKSAGIDEFRAELTPEDKCKELEKIRQESGITAFCGDGINDAPVLASADIGVAMGGLGSDAAIETADVVILDDRLSRLPAAVKISRRTMKIVYQCVAIAFLAKLAIIILELFGLAGMWAAVFADVGVTVICILNSLRALNFKPR